MTVFNLETATGDSASDGAAANGVELINGAYWQFATPGNSGTGQYFTFLAVQDKSVEEGYNTNATGVLDNDDSKTDAIPVSALVTVTNPGNGIPNGSYFVFRMDMNEPNSGQQGALTLDAFKIFTSANPALAGANFSDANEADPAGFTLRYNLDGAGDNSILLMDHSSGSGTDDYIIYVPTSLIPSGAYMTVYTRFSNVDSGFEEIRVRAFEGAPVIGITKTVTSVTGGVGAGNLSADSPGDIINYQVKVSNTGTVGATGVQVTDKLESGALTSGLTLTSGDTNSDGILDVGETWVYTGSYTVTQADLNTKGGGDLDIDNTASVTTAQTPTPLNASTSSPLVYNPSFTIAKTVTSVTGGVGSGSLTADNAGDVINYQVVVKNTGNIDLHGTIADKLENGALSSGLTLTSGDTDLDNVLDVGETWTYTGSYTVKQADITGKGGGDGDIDNTATFTTTEAGSASATTASPLLYNPSFSILKTVTSVTGGVGSGSLTADSAGDVINYQVVVKNTGNIDLHGTIADKLENGGLTSGLTLVAGGDVDADGVLDVGETWTYTGSYSVKQSDLNGKGGGDSDIDNTATFTTTEAGSASSSTSSPLAYLPSFSIQKTVTSVTGGAGTGSLFADNAGDVVNYQVVVKNTGDIDLTGTSIVDKLEGNGLALTGPTGDGGVIGVLEVGETWTYTASYVVTQNDLNTKGGADSDIDNLVTFTTNEAGSGSASTSSPLIYNPSFSIAKTVTSVTGGVGTGSLYADNAGDVVNYQVVVKNTGDIDLTGTSIVDKLEGNGLTLTGPTGDTDSDGVLDVGETWTYTASYAVTQADLNNKGGTDSDIDNLVTFTTKEAGSGSATTSSPLIYNPSFTIAKTVTSVTGGVGADSLTANNAGDIVNYQVVVKNTGNIDLNGTISDKVENGALTSGLTLTSGDTDSDNILDVGETWTYTGAYSVKQADLNNKGGGDGDLDNTATFTTKEIGSASATTSSPLEYSPSFTIAKTVTSVTGGVGADSLTANNAGDIVNYQVVVNNTGNIDLNGTISDKVENGALTSGLTLTSGDTDSDGVLDVGETWTYTGAYSVLQADLNSKGGGDGDLDNTATFTTKEIGSASATTSSPLEYSPSFTIAKTVTSVTGGAGLTADSAGDLINYQVVVKNTGNIDIHGTISDKVEGVSLTSGLTLASGDLDSDNVLDVGETWTYTGAYSVLQSDFNTKGGGDGIITNTATFTTTEAGSASATTSSPLTYTPSFTILKTVTSVTGGSGNSADSAGDVINYQVVVKNTGNVDLTGTSITDKLEGGGLALAGPSGDIDSDGVLDAGETWTYTGSYTVTQADFNGKGGGDSDIDNAATFTTKEAGSGSSSTSTALTYTPSFSIQKTVTSVTGGVGTGSLYADNAGDVINYQVVVKNTGNIDLTGTSISDTLEGGALTTGLTLASGDTDGDQILDVGEVWTYTGSYTVKQSDFSSNGVTGDGDIDNTATFVTKEAGSASSSTSSPLLLVPSFSILKTVTSVTGGVGNSADSVGDKINYQVVVKNTGNVDLTGGLISDKLENNGLALTGPSGDTDSDGVLDVGETWTYTGSYTVTQADLNSKGGGDGDIDNTATFTTKESGSGSSTTSTSLVYDPKFTIQKTVVSVTGGVGTGSLYADNKGDIINYQVVVKNTGNIDLTGTSISDKLENGSLTTGLTLLSGDTDGDKILDVGETWTYTGSYTVTQADLNTKGGGDLDIDNTATFTTNEAGSASSSTASGLVYNPSLSIVKTVTDVIGGSGNMVDSAGDVVKYQIVVKNTGNIDLTNVSVTDKLEGTGLSLTQTNNGNGDAILQVGESWTYTASYTVVAADITGNGGGDGDIDNIGYVTSTEAPGPFSSAVSTDIRVGPGVRTPGFWLSPNGLTFWDGVANNQTKSGPNFATHELLYSIQGKGTGLLVGDWNGNGQTDVGESTLYIKLSDALTILDASQKQQGDGRYVLGRDVIATWLNYLAGNGTGAANDPTSPHHLIDDAVLWFKDVTADHSADLTVAELATGAISTNSALWKSPIVANPPSLPYAVDHPAATLHTWLDAYNNTGMIAGKTYANDGDI